MEFFLSISSPQQHRKPSQGFRKFGFFSHPPWKVFGKFCTWSEFRVTHHVLSSLLPRKTFHSALKSYKNFPGWNKSPITIYSYFWRFSPMSGFFRTKINVLIGLLLKCKKMISFFLGLKYLPTMHCALWFWKENVGFKRCYFIEVQFNFPL